MAARQPGERLETDATPIIAPNNCSSSRVSLPEYMKDDDLETRREERDASLRSRSNPISVSEHSKPILVRQPAAAFPHYNTEIYRMTSRPKGLFLLVNNINFVSGKGTRHGAKTDQDNLMNLFRKLGYRVECVQDQTLQEMRRKIVQFSRRPELSRVDSVFVAIASHGQGNSVEDTEIISKDEGTLRCQEVVNQFNTASSPGMRYKPKVFLFQLCRGEGREYGEEATGKTLTDGNFTSDPCRLNDDVLVAHATVQGFPAFRNSKWGSWFVQALCKVYSENACEDDLETMHKKIDSLVKRCVHMEEGQHEMQTCTYHNQGFKKFYFNPGVYLNRSAPQMVA